MADAPEREIAGPAEDFEALVPGRRVGFDLGPTSRGLCVASIRVYESA